MHMHLAGDYSQQARTEIEGVEIQGIYEPTDCLEKKQQIARRPPLNLRPETVHL